MLDFWTYCCINCMHILPELAKLEAAFPNEIVVIGVHSAKFDEEKLDENIREAILRYRIKHPVVNDSDHAIWDAFGVGSWPSLRVIDPEGNIVAGDSGEVEFESLEKFFRSVIPYYQKKERLTKRPRHLFWNDFLLQIHSNFQARCSLTKHRVDFLWQTAVTIGLWWQKWMTSQHRSRW